MRRGGPALPWKGPELAGVPVVAQRFPGSHPRVSLGASRGRTWWGEGDAVPRSEQLMSQGDSWVTSAPL